MQAVSMPVLMQHYAEHKRLALTEMKRLTAERQGSQFWRVWKTSAGPDQISCLINMVTLFDFQKLCVQLIAEYVAEI
jgi:hypothetical protein